LEFLNRHPLGFEDHMAHIIVGPVVVKDPSFLFQPFLKKIDKLGVVNSRNILANSQYTAKRIREIYGCKASVCYPFVDLDLFKPIDINAVTNETCRKYNFSKPLLISTGRIIPLRRIAWLIDVMKNITKTFPSATLAITGEISQGNINYVREIEKKALSFGVERNVKFLGFVPDTELVKIYNAADAYVHICPHEAFGLSPVEAMACGAPVLATPVGAIPDVIRNGETGFLIPSNDPKNIAKRINELLSNPKLLEKASANAYKYVRANFSEEKVLESWRKMLREIGICH